VTRNQQILMMMTWAIPYHGLSPEDARAVAERVLDYFGGDFADDDPAEVIHKFHEEYYKASQHEGMVPTDAPRWEDYGYTRPPFVNSPGEVQLSDGTSVSGHNLGLALSNLEVQDPASVHHEGMHGVMMDGSLILASGGVVPPLASDHRECVWTCVFCDPTNITQEDIDELVASPPKLPASPSPMQSAASEAYNEILRIASDTAIRVNESMESGQGHAH